MSTGGSERTLLQITQVFPTSVSRDGMSLLATPQGRVIDTDIQGLPLDAGPPRAACLSRAKAIRPQGQLSFLQPLGGPRLEREWSSGRVRGPCRARFRHWFETRGTRVVVKRAAQPWASTHAASHVDRRVARDQRVPEALMVPFAPMMCSTNSATARRNGTRPAESADPDTLP